MSRAQVKKGRRRREPEFTRVRAETLSMATGRLFRILLIAGCLATIVPALPQWNQLKRIEGELAEVQGREARLAQDRERYESEEKALRENRFYLESRARDRLNAYKEGESIIRMED
ncbi:MAG: FtsB family cell division protein [Verrucomicrobiales bacterium]